MEAMKKYKAFTLAEVLITLAIIGVVAALTVPTVITNYKTKALETQKKKAMSVLSNGFRLLMANDNVTSLKNTKLAMCEDKECVTNEIKKAFNVVTDNNSENDIFNNDYQFDRGLEPVWTNGSIFYVFVASDGMIFGLQSPNDIVADINGVKNPNKGGQDLCNFYIDDHGAIDGECANTTDWDGTLICDARHHHLCDSEESCDAAGGSWVLDYCLNTIPKRCRFKCQ